MVWRVGEKDAYGLLAELLRETEGMEALPPIVRREGGKPCFKNDVNHYFSVSHSGELSLCALGEAPVGADIERVRPRGGGLPRYVLSGREYAWFEGRGSRWEDFYTLWTLKEARVKCTGEGIFRTSARKVSVPLLVPGETGEWEGFSFAALQGEGWRGAVCLKIL